MRHRKHVGGGSMGQDGIAAAHSRATFGCCKDDGGHEDYKFGIDGRHPTLQIVFAQVFRKAYWMYPEF
jgi:hypothetical protein